MFRCKGCLALKESMELLKSEVVHLRETNKKVTDQLIAATNLQAFNATTFGTFSGRDQKDYYGNDFDDVQTRDEFGNSYTIKRSALREE